jgi:hypothetical protein
LTYFTRIIDYRMSIRVFNATFNNISVISCRWLITCVTGYDNGSIEIIRDT